jgi:hypothetical protein
MGKARANTGEGSSAERGVQSTGATGEEVVLRISQLV